MNKKEIVVVIGPGRSGTSLATNLLCAHGMRTGRLIDKVDTANPVGYFEDEEIVKVHQSIFEALDFAAILPKDLTPAHLRRVRKQMDQLKGIVQTMVEQPGPISGFKDPRTTNLLPLWDVVFREAGVTPKFVLCIRSPGAVFTSMRDHYQRGDNLSELVWLGRVSESLLGSQQNLFLLHYEDWFEGRGAVDVAKQLLKYASLPIDGAADSVERIVRASLNRSEGGGQPANPVTLKMYEALRAVGSGVRPVESFVPLAKECRQVVRFCAAVVEQANAKSGLSPTLRQEHKQLQERIAALEAEAVELRDVREVNTTLQARVERLPEMEATKLVLERQMADAQARSASLQEDLQRQKAATQELASQLAQQQARAADELAQQQARAADQLTQQQARAAEQMAQHEARLLEQARAAEEQAALLKAQAAQAQVLERARADLEGQMTQMAGELERTKRLLEFEMDRNHDLGALRADLEGQLHKLREEHSSNIADLENLVEEHRRVVLRLKATVEDNERLRILAKAPPEPAPRREKPAPVPKPAPVAPIVVRKNPEPVRLSPARRKVRKLVRTPGLFFSDWYAKVRA